MEKDIENRIDLKKLDIERLVQELQTNAWNGKECDAYIKVENDLIEIHGYTYEPYYDSFAPTASISLNNECLFHVEDQNVGAYQNISIHKGLYKDRGDAIAFLDEKFHGKNYDLGYGKYQTTEKEKAKKPIKTEIKKTSKNAYITFSQKMIAWEKEHSDPTKIDIKTNEVMRICAVKLPSKEYRSLQFDKDANGIERNDRIATINVVKSFIRDNRNEDNKLLNHYTYLDPNREYNINFKGMEVGQENGKRIFDKPEQIKLTGTELTKMFKESRERSVQMKKDKFSQKESKENNVDKAKKEEKSKTKPKKAKKTEISR